MNILTLIGIIYTAVGLVHVGYWRFQGIIGGSDICSDDVIDIVFALCFWPLADIILLWLLLKRKSN